MSEKMIDVDGRQVSLSTIKEALKNHCDFQKKETMPIISFATCFDENDRVIIRLTDEIIEAITKYGKRSISINSSGGVGDSSKSPFYNYYCYTKVVPVFGEIVKD